MIEFVLLAVCFGVGTSLLGWWSLVPIALVWALLKRGAPWKIGAAAAVTWLALLGFTVAWGPLSRLATRAGGAVDLPGWAFVLASPLFAGLVAWSVARVTLGLSASDTKRR